MQLLSVARLPLIVFSFLIINACNHSNFSATPPPNPQPQTKPPSQTPTPAPTSTSTFPPQPGTLRVVVVDATTKAPIAGAAVALSPAGGLNGQTDASGVFQFQQLTAGANTATVSAQNYISESQPFTSSTGELHFALSPLLAANQIRIVLTWGKNPSDLDSHLTRVLSNGVKHHVWFAKPDAPDIRLDVDCVDSYGPETTTINKLNAGHYIYQVHDFTAAGIKNGAIQSSAAVVKLYIGSKPVQTFNAPATGIGVIWDVFEIDIDGSGNVAVKITNIYDNNSPLIDDEAD